MLEIFILALIQGITEFLPISSSSHLLIVSEFFNFDHDKKLEIDVSLHIGSFLAVITFFREDIVNFIKNKILFIRILIASIPIIIVGLALVQFDLINQFRNFKIIGWTTLIFGILLFISDKFKLEKEIQKDFSVKSSIVIGFFQVLSLIPGVSRSGIAITGARFLSFKRVDAVKISFLLSIPTLAAVSIFGIKNLIYSESFELSLSILLSIGFSYFFSFVTIKYFLKYIEKFNLNIFVFYRIVLGIFLIMISYKL